MDGLRPGLRVAPWPGLRQGLSPPSRTSKESVDAKLAAMECYDWVTPGQAGISDFSMHTPKFTPTTASQWTISF